MRKKLFCFILWNIRAVLMAMEFDYSQQGQINWGKKYPTCNGLLQSPIVIAASRSLALPLPALEMIGYHDFLDLPLIIRNNGHTVTLKVKHEFSRKRAPHIFGALLQNDRYELDSFHFHWGLKNSRGSEHILHGLRYSMEMHLVHRNMKYPNTETAMKRDDGLAVVGIFFEVVEDDNEHLKPIINHLAEVQWVNAETYLNTSLILAWLMPRDRDVYYTYKGSLTTPPCNEAVTWILFANPVPISYQQMNKFRMLSSGRTILGDNFRHVQEVGNRKVYVRKIRPNFIDDNEIKGVDSKSLAWHWS